jgi:serine/threonine-protein kinase greatwall
MSVSTPLSMVDLNQISRIKSPLPMLMSPSSVTGSTCDILAETPQKLTASGGSGDFPAPLPPPQFHTPPPQSGMSSATPFHRTPKSVRRRKHGGESTGSGRILGTPDYLAPELLLRQSHDAGVDWWAVGVCLYEFMTGIPPFNDSTPDLVFTNILALNIDWPEGEEALSEPAIEAIMAFLRLDPEKRANGKTIKEFELMKNVGWDDILQKTAPFIPQPENDADTTYFQTRNSMQGLKVSQIDL